MRKNLLLFLLFFAGGSWGVCDGRATCDGRANLARMKGWGPTIHGILRLRGGREDSAEDGGGRGDEYGGGGADRGAKKRARGSEGRSSGGASRKSARAGPGAGSIMPMDGDENWELGRASPKKGGGGGEAADSGGRMERLIKATGVQPMPHHEMMTDAIDRLHRAISRGDKKAQLAVLDKVADIAHKKHAKGIYDVRPLSTGGMAVGGSLRQLAMQKSTTAVTKTHVEYTGDGKSLDVIRDQAKTLGFPNPTDEAIGIDEHTELRLALEAANETRVIPDDVRTNRELHKYAKAMIGDMVVPEEIAIKHWLVKKREKAAQKKAYITAKRGVMMKKYAAMLYVMEKERCDREHKLFDPEVAETKALREAKYHYEIEPIKIQKLALAQAKAAGVQTDPAIVKPFAQKKGTRLRHKRKGPNRKLPKKQKVVKRVGGKKGGKKGKDGTGSLRKKRSGISGGKAGKSRFKKRKG